VSNPTRPLMPPTFELKPLPVEEWPNIDHIQTEDGAPVDSVFSEKQMRLLTESLYASWKPPKPYVAFANVGLFYGVDISPIVPDVLLSINVRLPESVFPKLNRSYFVWKYGKPPEVVIEIVSNKEGGEDTRKLEIYADVRVSNYVIYDPECHLSDQILRVFRLEGSQFVIDSDGPTLFPDVGLGLTIWKGEYEATDSDWLRWTDLDNQLIPTGAELANRESQRASQEFQRAEQESQRAEQESKRAEEANKRAEHESERAEKAEVWANDLVRENQRLHELIRQKGIDLEST
jgi:Uma2 family endonuclease